MIIVAAEINKLDGEDTISIRNNRKLFFRFSDGHFEPEQTQILEHIVAFDSKSSRN